MLAVIKTGGKQYIVKPGDIITIEKLPTAVGGQFTFDEVLLVEKDGKVTFGAPFVKGASVQAEIKDQGRGDKKIVFRYHNKTRYRKKKGHRQDITKVLVTEIKA